MALLLALAVEWVALLMPQTLILVLRRLPPRPLPLALLTG